RSAWIDRSRSCSGTRRREPQGIAHQLVQRQRFARAGNRRLHERLRFVFLEAQTSQRARGRLRDARWLRLVRGSRRFVATRERCLAVFHPQRKRAFVKRGVVSPTERDEVLGLVIAPTGKVL